MTRFSLFAALALFTCAAVSAQEVPVEGSFGRIGSVLTNTQTYTYFTEQRGAPTVRIELWGSVQSPGLYELQAGADLRLLLTLAGGVQFAETPGIKQSHFISIHRGGGGERTAIGPFDALTIPGNQNMLLEDGDTVVVRSETKRLFSYRDALTILATVLGIVIAAERLLQSN